MQLLSLCFRFTGQMALLSSINFYFDCKTRLCLIAPGRQEKIYVCRRKFLSTGILDDINEHDTSFLDCKHKHMMKSGAPPDKFGVLYRIVTFRIPWFHKQISFSGLSHFGSWSYLNFLETVCIPLILIFAVMLTIKYSI